MKRSRKRKDRSKREERKIVAVGKEQSEGKDLKDAREDERSGSKHHGERR